MKYLAAWMILLGFVSLSSCSSTEEMERAQESGQESEESIFVDEYDPYELGTDRFIWDEKDTIF